MKPLSISSFANNLKAFTKAFQNSQGNSDKLIKDFIRTMKREYGIDVKVKQ